MKPYLYGSVYLGSPCLSSHIDPSYYKLFIIYSIRLPTDLYIKSQGYLR
jgi:hypothetical protein